MENTEIDIEKEFKTQESLRDFCLRARQALSPYVLKPLDSRTLLAIESIITSLLQSHITQGNLDRGIFTEVLCAENDKISITFHKGENQHV